ncbi:MAG TPA: zinc-ribbon domain-containing protein [Lachnospiraceae bacterium]|nr:zinc-ribbon domain-containing protein [Lachnospiraceae bacterium]
MQEVINELINGPVKEIILAILVIALIECFFGFKLLKFWIAVIGFILGGVIFGLIGGYNGLGSETIILSFVGAILCAFISYKVYLIGVFISNFASATAASFLVFAILNNCSAEDQYMFAVIFGLIVAIIAVILVQPITILSTSISGGTLAGSAIAYLMKVEDPDSIGSVIGIIIALLGILYQCATNNGLMGNKKRVFPASSQTAASYEYQNNTQQHIYNQQFQPAQEIQQAPQFETAPQTQSPQQFQPVQQHRFCTNCGSPVAMDDRFCQKCGNSL